MNISRLSHIIVQNYEKNRGGCNIFVNFAHLLP